MPGGGAVGPEEALGQWHLDLSASFAGGQPLHGWHVRSRFNPDTGGMNPGDGVVILDGGRSHFKKEYVKDM